MNSSVHSSFPSFAALLESAKGNKKIEEKQRKRKS